MAITALFVSVATIIAERLATFISASAVVSLAMNAATAVFVTVYVLMAQRRSLRISVSLAFTAWLATCRSQKSHPCGFAR
jgi:hypothetical protein